MVEDKKLRAFRYKKNVGNPKGYHYSIQIFSECQEYAKAVPLSGRDICPFTAVQLIIGGEKANEREFPHMALIGYSKSLDDFDFLCGGSLISEQ